MRKWRASKVFGTLTAGLLASILGCSRNPDPEPQVPAEGEPRVPEERLPGSPSPELSADPNSPVVPKVDCRADADCAPASCCHAESCVPRAQAPACDDVMCTQECRKGTLDCGGSCACEAGRCTAKLGGDSWQSSPPSPVGALGPVTHRHSRDLSQQD